MSGKNCQHFFQSSDWDMHSKTLEREILDTVTDFLHSRNVDTSEIKERQTTILNHGIVVQGGKLQANAVAVGKSAKANVFSKLKARARPAAAK